jgi:hypothetical protein
MHSRCSPKDKFVSVLSLNGYPAILAYIYPGRNQHPPPTFLAHQDVPGCNESDWQVYPRKHSSSEQLTPCFS